MLLTLKRMFESECTYKIFLLILISCSYQPNKLFSVNTLAIDASESITGNMSVGGTLGSTGSFSVNTNKFTVDGATGNTTIAGTLTAGTVSYTSLRVTGSTTLLGSFAVNQNKMTVDAVGNTIVGGTLGVTGASTLSNDLRVTGSTNLLGKLAINQNKMTVDAAGNTSIAGTLGVSGVSTLSNDLRVTGSTCLLGKLSVNQTKMTVDSVGNTVVGGTLDVTGSLGSGWHHIFGEKSLASIGTTATAVLSITFANLAGASSPLFKGARLRLYAIIAGSVTLITAANSVNYYYGDIIVSPGATSGTACTLNAVTETSTAAVGNGTTITSSVTGNGTSATLNLTASSAVTSPSVDLFYEIVSDNLSSIS